MSPLLLKANELKKQYKFRAPKAWTDEEKESILNDFTFHNNKLEGLKLEYGDTIDFLKKGIIRKNSDIKDITDLRNHKSLLKKIFEMKSIHLGTVMGVWSDLSITCFF